MRSRESRGGWLKKEKEEKGYRAEKKTEKRKSFRKIGGCINIKRGGTTVRKKAGGLVGRWSKKTKERNQKSRELERGKRKE